MNTVSNSTVRCVGGIAHDELGRILLIRRANEPGRGLWSVPGGRVEPGETDEAAVIREMREETGLDVMPGTYVGNARRGPFDIHDYACSITGGTLRAGDDAGDARWIDAETLIELDKGGRLAELLFVTLRDWGVLPTANASPA
ncbi:NUDIX hydrolase [Amycolatopsis sp. BJA-103]|uniref:NUDIX hydrolase n=1 Tax=Amycolatopsis sp. BJA-103 TaxID=1911175 RepID=UPI000C7598AE|nr:NUDIX domain-containing protein [Amycolatopsis sp. BJA-103]AUI63653.1 NUDIX hydrolase [Amycolatopsis sp. BJA-103]PNE19498.1 NUDIX hydrolase [Amycolatopsis sp. BJA-103]